jgi:hypothetical protein
MKRLPLVLAFLSVAGLIGASIRAESKDTKPSAKAYFASLKKLAGDWEGKGTHGGGDPIDVKVEYKVTAAGSSVMERLFCGTPHEMITMYHLDGDNLLLTHYCAAGNQPRMKAEAGKDAGKIAFKFLDGTNLKVDQGMHMHDLTIELAGDDHIKTEWVSYMDGKPAGTATFDLKRKK